MSTSEIKNFTKRALLACLAAVVSAALSPAMADDFFNMRVLVAEQDIEWNVDTRVGAYCYNADTDTFYIGTFGMDKSLVTIQGSGNSSWLTDTYVPPPPPSGGWDPKVYAYPSDLTRFMLSSDIPGGVTSADHSGFFGLSGMLLNPTPLTVDGLTYEAGELAFISDLSAPVVASGANQYSWTKKLYRWDLRSIGSETTVSPDYDTGQSGDGNPNSPPSPFGALGQADWNDVFTVCIDAQELRDETARVTGVSQADIGRDNFGRQFAWSTSGQFVYCVDTGYETGGIYKADAATGSVRMIYSEPSPKDGEGNRQSNLISEPGVMHTSVHNLGTTMTGDQILFDGSQQNGNPGGINFIVDSGPAVSAPQVLVHGSEIWDYCEAQLDDEEQGGGVRSITTDLNGDVYFYSNGALHRRDAQGRFICVVNKAQACEFNLLQGGSRSDGGGLLRLQIHHRNEGDFLTYRSDNAQIASVQLFESGDLDYDGAVDHADKEFLVAQYKATCYKEEPTATSDLAAYRDYIRADINGSSHSDENYHLVAESCVTFRDIEVMAGFVGLEFGDFDWDGEALTPDDWAVFDAHFDVTRQDLDLMGGWSWFDGDVTGDGLVDSADLAMLRPIPGDANRDGTVDDGDAAILAQNWGARANPRWDDGDFDGDGMIGVKDAAILAANWLSSSTPSSEATSVPEPTTAAILLLSTVLLGLKRSRSGTARLCRTHSRGESGGDCVGTL
jgi:hypothetical protein